MRTGYQAICLLITGCGRIGFDLGTDGSSGEGDGLRLTPADAIINVGSAIDLVVEGGVPPYQFALVSGEGWVAPGGAFVAPTRAGTTTISVTDQASATATTTVRYEGQRLILAGGITSAPASTVWTSTDGATWSVLGDLPARRANGGMIVYRDRIYYLGGVDENTTHTATIFASSDGATWSTIGTLPSPRTSMAVAVHDSAVWLVGGYSGSDHAEVYRSTDLVAWTRLTDIPVAMHELDAISRGGTLYVIGGHGAALSDDVFATTDGAQWSTSTNVLGFTTDFPGVGELGERVFRACGTSCDLVETSTDLVTWTDAAPLGVSLDGPVLVGFRGELLVIGGGETTVRATVDGSAWTTPGALPEAVARSAIVQFTPP